MATRKSMARDSLNKEAADKKCGRREAEEGEEDEGCLGWNLQSFAMIKLLSEMGCQQQAARRSWRRRSVLLCATVRCSLV